MARERQELSENIEFERAELADIEALRAPERNRSISHGIRREGLVQHRKPAYLPSTWMVIRWYWDGNQRSRAAPEAR